MATVVEKLEVETRDPAHSALATAILTRPDVIPAKTRRDLAPLIGKYLK